MPRVSRGRALLYLGVVLVLLLLGGRFLAAQAGSSQDGSEEETSEAALQVVASSPDAATEPASASVVVHVVGAVRRPGLYDLAQGSRVDDAIRSAGGAKPAADLALVNLAAPIADGQQIVVPARGAPAAGERGASVPGAAAVAAQAGPVHLNTATLEQLDALPGIGPVTAQRILDYRDQHGGFRSVDELDAVPGIGPARLDQLRELVAV